MCDLLLHRYFPRPVLLQRSVPSRESGAGVGAAVVWRGQVRGPTGLITIQQSRPAALKQFHRWDRNYPHQLSYILHTSAIAMRQPEMVGVAGPHRSTGWATANTTGSDWSKQLFIVYEYESYKKHWKARDAYSVRLCFLSALSTVVLTVSACSSILSGAVCRRRGSRLTTRAGKAWISLLKWRSDFTWFECSSFSVKRLLAVQFSYSCVGVLALLHQAADGESPLQAGQPVVLQPRQRAQHGGDVVEVVVSQ